VNNTFNLIGIHSSVKFIEPFNRYKNCLTIIKVLSILYSIYSFLILRILNIEDILVYYLIFSLLGLFFSSFIYADFSIKDRLDTIPITADVYSKSSAKMAKRNIRHSFVRLFNDYLSLNLMFNALAYYIKVFVLSENNETGIIYSKSTETFVFSFLIFAITFLAMSFVINYKLGKSHIIVKKLKKRFDFGSPLPLLLLIGGEALMGYFVILIWIISFVSKYRKGKNKRLAGKDISKTKRKPIRSLFEAIIKEKEDVKDEIYSSFRKAKSKYELVLICFPLIYCSNFLGSAISDNLSIVLTSLFLFQLLLIYAYKNSKQIIKKGKITLKIFLSLFLALTPLILLYDINESLSKLNLNKLPVIINVYNISTVAILCIAFNIIVVAILFYENYTIYRSRRETETNRIWGTQLKSSLIVNEILLYLIWIIIFCICSFAFSLKNFAYIFLAILFPSIVVIGLIKSYANSMFVRIQLVSKKSPIGLKNILDLKLLRFSLIWRYINRTEKEEVSKIWERFNTSVGITSEEAIITPKSKVSLRKRNIFTNRNILLLIASLIVMITAIITLIAYIINSSTLFYIKNFTYILAVIIVVFTNNKNLRNNQSLKDLLSKTNNSLIYFILSGITTIILIDFIASEDETLIYITFVFVIIYIVYRIIGFSKLSKLYEQMKNNSKTEVTTFNIFLVAYGWTVSIIEGSRIIIGMFGEIPEYLVYTQGVLETLVLILVSISLFNNSKLLSIIISTTDSIMQENTSVKNSKLDTCQNCENIKRESDTYCRNCGERFQ